jgi:hypothetical protein
MVDQFPILHQQLLRPGLETTKSLYKPKIWFLKNELTQLPKISKRNKNLQYEMNSASCILRTTLTILNDITFLELFLNFYIIRTSARYLKFTSTLTHYRVHSHIISFMSSSQPYNICISHEAITEGKTTKYEVSHETHV